MKNINFIKNLFLVLLFAGFFSACSENAMDKVNFDPNHPHDVPAKFILTDVMTSTAFNVVGGDIDLYASIYIEHEAGVWNQQYNAEKRIGGETTSATTFNNVWSFGIYPNIRELKEVIDKTSDGGPEEGNNLSGGIAKVLLAYNAAILTDFFGDAPFSQTGVMNDNGTPKYLQPELDKQADIYQQIQSLLDEAIAQIPQGDTNPFFSPIGSQDLIYGGSRSLWVKAAYGLKARYLMHTLFRSSDVNGDLNKILDYISKSFGSADEEFKFDQYDGDSNVNPFFGFSYSRDGLGVSHSLAQKFKDLDDPRGDQSFMDDYYWEPISLDDALDQAVPNGNPIQQQGIYPSAIVEIGATVPTQLLSYHELLFLQAEAEARLGNISDAETTLQSAIEVAFANLENSLNATDDYWGLGLETDLSQDVADDYFTNSVLPRFNANPLQEIMLQKYLAFFGASGESGEAYNDYRRLKAMGADYVTLENPNNAQGKFPLRYSYGGDDVTANPNIYAAYGDGSYVYTENVWWAGGTR